MTVKINQKGAEIVSVKDQKGTEYIWGANKEYWKRHAPILFPIVGRLQDDDYIYDGNSYHMYQHGFARDSEFEIESHNKTEVNFMLHSNAATRKIYPFNFNLSIHYELDEHTIAVEMVVENINPDPMYFSLGAHPGFNVPLFPKRETFDDYSVSVAPKHDYKIVRIDQNGYSNIKHPVEKTLDNPLQLKRDLFKHDAKVLDVSDNEQTTVMLQSDVTDHGVALTAYDCKYIGIWSTYPKEAPFVCLEPWWGIADEEESTGFLKDKADISKLDPNESLNANFDITFF